YLAIRIRFGRPRDVLDESGCGAMTARSRQARMPLLALGSERDHSSRRYPYLLDLSRQASGLLKHAHDVVIRHQHHRRLRKIYVIGVAELPTQGGDQRRDVGESCHTSSSNWPPTFGVRIASFPALCGNEMV